MFLGSHIFDVETSPLLKELLMNASKRVPSFVSNVGYDSLYDLWVRGSPSDNDNTKPRQVVFAGHLLYGF